MGCIVSRGKTQARSAAVAFAVISFVFLSIYVGLMFTAAMACEGNRRSYVWLSRGFGCLLRGASLGFIIAWIVAAGQDNLRIMVLSSTAIATHVLGMCVYFAAYVVHNATKDESAADIVQVFGLHWEEIPSLLPSWLMLLPTSVEALFLCCLIRYQQDLESKSSVMVASAPANASAVNLTGAADGSQNKVPGK